MFADKHKYIVNYDVEWEDHYKTLSQLSLGFNIAVLQREREEICSG